MSDSQDFGDNLRVALARADAGGQSAPIGGGRTLPRIADYSANVVEDPGDMIVSRLAIPRVKIKQEVASYVEMAFLSRTNMDGTILRPSKESLIEELTGLFHMLEQNSGYIDEPKPARRAAPSSARGRPEPRTETQSQ